MMLILSLYVILISVSAVRQLNNSKTAFDWMSQVFVMKKENSKYLVASVRVHQIMSSGKVTLGV